MAMSIGSLTACGDAGCVWRYDWYRGKLCEPQSVLSICGQTCDNVMLVIPESNVAGTRLRVPYLFPFCQVG
jgi:hypothetical protein